MVAMRFVYPFIGDARGRGFVRFSRDMHDELAALQGLVVVCASRDLNVPEPPLIFCGDATLEGYSFSYSHATPQEVRELGRCMDRWVPKGRGDRHARRRHPPWEPRQRLAPADESWAEGEAVRDEGRGGNHWQEVLHGAWKNKQAVQVLEARVDLLSIRHCARNRGMHGTHIVIVTDSLVSAGAREKCPSKDPALRAVVARCCASCLVCGFKWSHRYVCSELVPLTSPPGRQTVASYAMES